LPEQKLLDWVGPLVLCAEEVSRVPEGIPGVYLLHSFDRFRGLYPALYVGKAGDLQVRLFQHLQTGSTSPDVRAVRSWTRMYFSAAPVLAVPVRNGIEAGLIRMLRPAFNRQVPRAVPIFTTLPPMVLTLWGKEMG
jgi:excinuclease UvrABC nuclease subunit